MLKKILVGTRVSRIWTTRALERVKQYNAKPEGPRAEKEKGESTLVPTGSYPRIEILFTEIHLRKQKGKPSPHARIPIHNCNFSVPRANAT